MKLLTLVPALAWWLAVVAIVTACLGAVLALAWLVDAIDRWLMRRVRSAPARVLAKLPAVRVDPNAGRAA